MDGMGGSNDQHGKAPARALIVTPVGPDGMGGIDRLYFYMREHHAKAGGAVDIRYFAGRGPGGGARWMLSFPFRVLAFIATLLSFRPDVVHINHSTHGSAVRKWVLASVAKALGFTVTTHFHGLVSAEDYAAKPAWLALFRSLLAKSDGIIILGDFFSGDLQGRFDIPAAKLTVIPNGIPDFAADLPVPKPEQDPPVILFAGEVGPRKGAGLLLEALAILRQRVPRWSCVIAGNGDLPEYKSMARMLGLNGHVRFTGWVNADEVHDLMRQADVVVLPSRIEALPLSLIEGACAGAALVASNAGASAEIAVAQRNGIVVPLTADAIADALGLLLLDRPALLAMQAESRALYMERFRIETFEAALSRFLLAAAGRPAENGLTAIPSSPAP
jgi:glycosyltransferase involved in cell wall biosynthesis